MVHILIPMVLRDALSEAQAARRSLTLLLSQAASSKAPPLAVVDVEEYAWRTRLELAREVDEAFTSWRAGELTAEQAATRIRNVVYELTA